MMVVDAGVHGADRLRRVREGGEATSVAAPLKAGSLNGEPGPILCGPRCCVGVAYEWRRCSEVFLD